MSRTDHPTRAVGHLEAFYPSSLAVILGVVLPASAVAACDLSDRSGGWAYAPRTFLIDPVLGRLSLPASLTVEGKPWR